MMTKQQALKLFDGSSPKLAKALGISRQAIHKWGDDEPIPELREMKIRHEIIPKRKTQNRPRA